MSLLPVGCCLWAAVTIVFVRVVDSTVHPACIGILPDYGWRGRTLNEQGIEQLTVGALPTYKERQEWEWRSIVWTY
jgi:hypothetical protein